MSHYEDEAEVEQLRRWWRENWPAIATGVALGLGGILGWEAWQGARDREALEASRIYEDLKAQLPASPDRAAELGQRLADDYGGTPYAAQAGLLLAQHAAQQGLWTEAREHLEPVARDAGDEGLRKIARLRLARVLWQQQRPEEALAQLEIPENDPFAPLYLELRGDIALSQGDRAAARGLYEQALKLEPGAATRDLLSRKLDDLADVAS